MLGIDKFIVSMPCGTVPEITDEEADDTNIITVTLPALSNKEILIDKDFNATYRIDSTKVSSSAIDENVLTTRELVCHAYCLIFAQVVCNAVKSAMDEIRSKAPAFEGEFIISV